MTNGWPWALARMLASTKPRPNMNGWNCSAASRIQNRPSTICSTRWVGTARGKRRAGPVSFVLVVPLPELVSLSMALDSGYRAGPGWSGSPGVPPLSADVPGRAGLRRQALARSDLSPCRERPGLLPTTRGLWRAWTEITPKSRHRRRSGCLTACTSTPDPRHVGPAGEPDRLADALVGPAAELARHWLESAAPTRSERARSRRLHALTSDPGSVSFAMAFCDRVLRPESPRVAALQLRRLAGGPEPTFLSPADRTLLRWGARLSSAFPGTVVPLARRRLRALVGDLVADAEDPALGHHLARLRAEGFGVNVNLLGEAVLGHEEAGRRRDAVVALMARPDVDYVSVKVSSVAAQLNLWAYRETLARTKDALRPMLRAAASASPPTFVNLDMEEYKDLSLTLDAFTQLLDEPEFLELEAGVVLQAYIPDSLDALVRLSAWALRAAPTRRRPGQGAHRQGGQPGRRTCRRRHARVAAGALRDQGRDRRQSQGDARVRPAS